MRGEGREMRDEQQPKIMNGDTAVWQKCIGLGCVRSPLTPRLAPLKQVISAWKKANDGKEAL